MGNPQFDHQILLVNDTIESAKLIAIMLQRSGWQNTLIAKEALEALKILDDVKVDLIITDDMMPGMHGFDLIRHLRATPEYATMPIILTTLRTYKAEQLMELSLNDILYLPIQPFELSFRVARLLHVDVSDLATKPKKA